VRACRSLFVSGVTYLQHGHVLGNGSCGTAGAGALFVPDASGGLSVGTLISNCTAEDMCGGGKYSLESRSNILNTVRRKVFPVLLWKQMEARPTR
jgi:hypothetical protein